MENIKYRKLPGRGFKSTLFTRCTVRLWMGPDHILCQYARDYTEEYKRFYYRDIQAIAISTTDRGKLINIALYSLAALTAVIYGIRWMQNGFPETIIYLIIGGAFFLAGLVNTIMGPTSRGYLITAVTKEELPSLNRLRTARKALRMLKPLIVKAQGGLSADDLRAGLEAPEGDMPQTGRKTHVRDLPARAVTQRAKNKKFQAAESAQAYVGWMHIALFLFVLMDAAMMTADIFTEGVAVSLLSILSYIITSVLLVVCLVRQQGLQVSSGLKGLMRGALVYIVISYCTGIILYMYMFVSGSMISSMSSWQHITTMARYPIAGDRFVTAIYASGIVVSLFIGISGLLVSFNDLRARRLKRVRRDV